MTSRSDTERAIGVDALITEVRKRPAIWNKSEEDYSDRLVRLKLWDEICEKTVPNWDDLSSAKRRSISVELQKKWRNLRDAFNKELAIQRKNDEPGQGSKRKRLYVHFEALSFLTSQFQKKDYSNKDTSSNISIDSEDSDSSEQEIRPTLKRKDIVKDKDRDEDDLQMTSECKKYDEDVSFTEMLIPMFKKLNDDQKLFARIEILQILNKAKYHCPSDCKTEFLSCE